MMKEKEMTKYCRIYLRQPAAIKRDIEKLAKKSDRSVNKYIELLLKERIKKEK